MAVEEINSATSIQKMMKLNVYVFMDVRVILCLSYYGFWDEVLHKSGELLLTLNQNNRLFNIPFITSKAKP
ncbi:MAG: hypothetical protein OEZ45_09530 [Candidatus Aminicenantes bacterium]|nr:hypothetical protein [Candidatus Aminicenantes bacterium]